ncbi:MAG: hypothetical protein INR71_08065 [Terriglobus roseus]|nr:hypothetical protein [Terriglobus roseus]
MLRLRDRLSRAALPLFLFPIDGILSLTNDDFYAAARAGSMRARHEHFSREQPMMRKKKEGKGVKVLCG